MNETTQPQFPGTTQVFRSRRLPEPARPAGYAALIDAYGLQVPLPRILFAVGEHHRVVEERDWKLMTPRHAPPATLDGHLTFALKYEGVDLAVLKRLFSSVGPGAIEEIVRSTPTGTYARRIWFLYEWLTDRKLDLADADGARYVPVIDPQIQYAIDGTNSRRHRVRNNLPGTPAFCPLVFRTDELDAFASLGLPERAHAAVAKVPADLLARTAAFLLLQDSRSSYAIEGERAPQDRIQRWGRAIGQAGKHPLDRAELLRLQEIVIGDARFIRLGLRDDDGFVGEHDRQTRAPIPVHISARPRDLDGLIDGIGQFAGGAGRQLDPIVAAASLAFGFVYIHPFQDGNGRVHRYLIHHVLSRRGFHPLGVVFPVSSAILERIRDYEATLESYSQRMLPLVDWKPRPDGNIVVQNDTADFYRYFDATPHAEFLYGCVRKTIEEDLPAETEFLHRYDRFERHVELLVDMPGATIDLLFRFLKQNEGRLSKRARTREFAALTSEEVREIEAIYADIFDPNSIL
jgi:hypothetical protein